MTEKRKIRFGLPIKNLNKPESEDHRGHTNTYMKKANFKMRNYDPGEEGKHGRVFAEGEEDIEFILVTPREIPELLEDGTLDLAITGSDTACERYSSLWPDEWQIYLDTMHFLRKDTTHNADLSKIRSSYEYVMERHREDINRMDRVIRNHKGEGQLSIWNLFKSRVKSIFEKREIPLWMGLEDARLCNLADLGYGKMDIHWESPVEGMTLESLIVFLKSTKERNKSTNDLVNNPPLKIASAYPNITYAELCKYLPPSAIRLSESSDKESHANDIAPKITIHSLRSKTEQLGRLGFGLVVDGVASGRSLRKYNLTKVGPPIMTSTAHLYTNSAIGGMYNRGGVYASFRITERRRNGFGFTFSEERSLQHELQKLAKEVSKDYSAARHSPLPESNLDVLNRKINTKIKWAAAIKRYEGIDLKRLDEIVQRLSGAAKEYGRTHNDSIWYPGGKP